MECDKFDDVGTYRVLEEHIGGKAIIAIYKALSIFFQGL